MTPAWMYRGLALVGVVIGLGVLKSCYDGQIAHRVRLRHEADSLKVAARGHQQRADSLAAAFRIDTSRLTHTVTRWRTVREEVPVSVTVPGVVPETPRESTFVAAGDSALQTARFALAAADTAITQCERTVFTCTALVAAKDSELIVARAQINNERKRRPSMWSRGVGALKWVAVGAAAALVARP